MDIKKEYERWLAKATVTLPLARAVCAASSAQARTG